MIDFTLFSTGERDRSLCGYGPISVPTAKQISSLAVPLNKPYILLGPNSGGAATGVSYFVDTVKYPDSQSSFKNAKRMMYSMRNTGGVLDFIPENAINGGTPGGTTPGPLAILANLSSGQFLYFGPKNSDLYSPSIFHNLDGKWTSIVSEQVIAQGCRPFFAKHTDNLELCLISPFSISVNLIFQFADFDVPVWNGDFGGGGYLSAENG